MFGYGRLVGVPPRPEARVMITYSLPTGKKIDIGPFTAQIDSGAERSCIPRGVMPQGETFYYTRVMVTSPATAQSVITVCLVSKELAVDYQDLGGTSRVKRSYQGHFVLPLIPADVGLIGRDILNQHECELNGPGLIWKLGG